MNQKLFTWGIAASVWALNPVITGCDPSNEKEFSFGEAEMLDLLDVLNEQSWSIDFEGSSVETFEGFYYDSSLHTPILGVSQFAQITLPTESEFSLAGIARYLVAGQKIDFNFDFNNVPAPSTLAPLLCLGARARRRKC